MAHLRLADQQALMEEAREKDESELVKYLHHLSRYDHKILKVLNVQEGRQRRIEDLLVGLTQVLVMLSRFIFVIHIHFSIPSVRIRTWRGAEIPFCPGKVYQEGLGDTAKTLPTS